MGNCWSAEAENSQQKINVERTGGIFIINNQNYHIDIAFRTLQLNINIGLIKNE